MRRFSLILVSVLALLLCSCANKAMTRYETLAPALKKGGFEGAINKAKKDEKDLYGSNSVFLYNFDLGTLHHYNGDYAESAKYLDKAEEVYEDLYTKSVTNEAAAIATNDNVRPYRARPFEIIMLHEYQILNYLAMQDIDGALVEAKRANLALERLYQKDNEKVNDNGLLRYLIAMVFDMAGEGDDAAIAYVKAVKAFDEGEVKLPKEAWEFVNEQLNHMDRNNDLNGLKHEPLAQTPKATKAREMGQEIVIVGYAGHSPILGEMYMSGTFVSGGSMHLNYKDGQTGRMSSITLIAPPVPGGSSGTFHVGFSLPEKRTLKQSVAGFAVSVDKQPRIKPEMYMDVDSELDKNLKDESSTTITRTAVRVILRTIAAQKAKSATNTGNGVLDLLKNIAVDVGQSQLEQADLRVGLFMPNTVHMVRIPVEPGSHSVSVNTLNYAGGATGEYSFDNVKVSRGQKIFLFVPAIR